MRQPHTAPSFSGRQEGQPESTGHRIRAVMLEVLQSLSGQGPGCFQSGSILQNVQKELGLRIDDDKNEQAILTVWSDLFRNGQLAPGFNLNNPDLPFVHLTEQGRRTLEHYSRDPANPDGYLAYLNQQGTLDSFSMSYVHEALACYNANCCKAAAVMIGAASERLLLNLRDAVVANLRANSKAVSKHLTDWQTKTVRDAVTKFLDQEKPHMPKDLKELYEGFWLGFTESIRRVRNDAGHPEKLDSVSPEIAHASLLIFPQQAALVDQLISFVN